MKLLCIGPDPVYNGLVASFPETIVCTHSHQAVDTSENFHVVFDALFDERHELSPSFIYPASHLIIGAAVKRKLSGSVALLRKHIAAPCVGMNMLPGFISSKTKEISSDDPEALKRFAALAMTWQWNYKTVTDSVGMVTPRVLAMVINEAARTLEEKTATKEDIDKGMELGTGYPQGPLKWCDAIGVEHITDVLQALHEATKDERYRVAQLLTTMRQSRGTFY